METQDFHTVVEGETCENICYQHNLTLKDLESYNPGINLKTLQKDQKIRITQPPPLVSTPQNERICSITFPLKIKEINF
jgi:hypothetical protein